MRVAAHAETHRWEQVRAVCYAYLDACLERDVQRIVVLDAASVLGWRAWCEIDKRHGLGVLQERFDAALEAGLIDPQPIESVAQLVLGALNVAGRVIAEAKDPKEARKQVGQTIDRLISGLQKKKKKKKGSQR